jgi:hypothetical protein
MVEVVRVQASGPKHRAIVFFPTANGEIFIVVVFLVYLMAVGL